MFMKFYLVKLRPIFVGSQLRCLARYQKILWECSFGCKNLFNFNCHTMKFHKCVYTKLDRLTKSRIFCVVFPWSLPCSRFKRNLECRYVLHTVQGQITQKYPIFMGYKSYKIFLPLMFDYITFYRSGQKWYQFSP